GSCEGLGFCNADVPALFSLRELTLGSAGLRAGAVSLTNVKLPPESEGQTAWAVQYSEAKPLLAWGSDTFVLFDIVRTDHADLKWLLQFKNLEGKDARWIERLQEFFDIQYRARKYSIAEKGTNRKIFYLVTKKASYQKPNCEDVWNALCSLREVLIAKDLKKLAIPKLACGLDNLDWGIIRSML
ncbi:unnamed protein product, partial [Acanthoscelides obtectus]